MRTHRLLGRVGLGTLAAATVVAAAPAAAPAATSGPYCGIVWGSLVKTDGPSGTTGTIDDVRSGRHACFDRLVVDVDDVPGDVGYRVRFVNRVRSEGSGTRVGLRGGADLRIRILAPAHDDRGRATYRVDDARHLVDVDGYRTFRQVAWAGSFEGRTTIGLGVRARLPFRVFTLDGPGDGARVVVDVAHRW